MTLQEIYNKHKKGEWPDKGSVHSYIEVYEEILKPYRNIAKNILEIGLMSGESMGMWREYFSGEVFGIDCDIKPIGGQADLTGVISEGYNIVIGDASKPMDIARFFTGIKFDVVIEDANHNSEQQIDIFYTIYPYLNEGAIYVIEDIQDIDTTWENFTALGAANDMGVEIIDRRKVKNRYDDVLVIIK